MTENNLKMHPFFIFLFGLFRWSPSLLIIFSSLFYLFITNPPEYESGILLFYIIVTPLIYLCSLVACLGFIFITYPVDYILLGILGKKIEGNFSAYQERNFSTNSEFEKMKFNKEYDELVKTGKIQPSYSSHYAEPNSNQISSSLALCALLVILGMDSNNIES